MVFLRGGGSLFRFISFSNHWINLEYRFRSNTIPSAHPSFFYYAFQIRVTFLAFVCPTIPCETCLASKASSNPKPRIWECAPMRSIRVRSFTSAIFVSTFKKFWNKFFLFFLLVSLFIALISFYLLSSTFFF